MSDGCWNQMAEAPRRWRLAASAVIFLSFILAPARLLKN
jgi:hypothetical protein